MGRSTWQAVRYRERVQTLTQYLLDEQVIDPRAWNSRAWLTGLHEVPRHTFVPERAWASAFTTTGSSHLIDKHADASDWWNTVYGNYSLITQRAEGNAEIDDTTAEPTCSLSCPAISMAFLDLLDVCDHHRVLEIGTGTGWTAAMLAWRLGARNVVTVEVDKALAETARANLANVVEQPEVITGDGVDGFPSHAPYDRVHVTCGVRDIPHAWIEQTRPGGQIVLPYMPIGGAFGHQLRLDVLDPEGAIGRFTGGGGFMMLRDQRTGPPRDEVTAAPGAPSTTRMDPRLIAEASGGGQLAIAALTPGLTVDTAWTQTADGWAYTATLFTDSALASCTALRGADEYTVVQHGDTRLWDQAVGAYLWWLGKGRPGPDRFGISVDAERQWIWLDEPCNELS
ncbi:methyltransferase domain-containing protein [Actinomadura rubrisoli]|uniref:methyltransferase domain-containing protein n=1 Tax=Actinomadura rubrisoli TaxID=2530368 RepID=UPI0014055470|nr:methyltransferase domain-containing protein [Actinomadura rubrisoli]